jgi:ubiquinone/menaquinone biosynthesis C-methylase UbiE
MNPMREHDETETTTKKPLATRGRVLHSARAYDLLAWLFLHGREPAFRRRTIEIAGLTPGASVLDVGCGTGTLAIVAKEHVGASGDVRGIDASPEMIARARKKAKRAGLDVGFENAVVEAMPFADAHFDVLLCTLMLHHLPSATRGQGAREMRRVLKPGGRLVVVDFGAPGREEGARFGRFHRHGWLDAREIVRVLEGGGFRVGETGSLGVKDMQFVTATRAP